MLKYDAAIADDYRKLRSDLDEHVAAVHAKIKAEARRVIETVAAKFFAANPSVLAIRWTQYTPYWSDGDATVFRPNSPDLQIFEIEKDEGDRYFEGQQNFLKNREYRERSIKEIETEIAAGPMDDADPRRDRHRRPRGPVQLEQQKAEIAEIDAKIARVGGAEAYARIVADFEAACSVIKSIKKSDFEIVFGDHVQVFLTKNGVRVDEYEHD